MFSRYQLIIKLSNILSWCENSRWL